MSTELVNVLVIISKERLPVSEESLRRISAASPKIELRYVSDVAPEEELDALLARAEVIYGFAPPQNVIARAPKLKWIQTMIAGVDHFLDADIVQSPVIVTTASGIHGQVAEVTLEMMLMFAKRAPLCFQLKQAKQWQPFTPSTLRSKTVGILGLGSIGREVARLAKAFGMRVIAVRVKQAVRARYADVILPPERLRQLLSESDFVAVTLPYTPETSGLIGEAELREMKPTAYLINVARGGIVDEDALIRALDENWIAGAGLDVFATEPLPADSRLWELPNVIFMPHVSGRRENIDVLATELFCENLGRYLSGKKLLNVVDKKRGY